MAVNPQLMRVDYAGQLGQLGQTIGQGIQGYKRGQTQELAGKAMMGDPSAMEGLMMRDPAMAAQVQDRLSAQQAAQQQQEQAILGKLAEEKRDLFERLGGAETPEDFVANATRAVQVGMYPTIASTMGKEDQFDAEDYGIAKTFRQLSLDPEKKTGLIRDMDAMGLDPATPEGQEFIRDYYEKSGGTNISVNTGTAGATDEFDRAFGDSGEGRRLAIQARSLSRKEEIPPQEAIERVALQKDVTQSERTADTYYQRMVSASGDLNAMENEGYSPSAGDTILSNVPGGNFLVGDKYQLYKTNAKEWIRAKLRKESGAAIPPEEERQEYETYFYMPGDSPETIKLKQRRRAEAERALGGERSRLGGDEEQEGGGATPEAATPQRMRYNPETGELEPAK